MLAVGVEVRDAGARGRRGLFAGPQGICAGTAVVLEEPPVAYAPPGGQGEEGDSGNMLEAAPLRLLLDAFGRQVELRSMLCAAELPEERRAAARCIARSAMKLRRSCPAPSGPAVAAEVTESDTEDLLVRLYCNTHSLDDGGMAVYAQASAINHDCDPNCTFFGAVGASSTASTAKADAGTAPALVAEETERPALTVRALRDISPNEELTIGYVPLRLPRRMRAAQLQRNYGFECKCRRCIAEQEVEDDEDEAKVGEQALIALSAKLQEAITSGSAGTDPGRLNKLLAQANQLARFQSVLAGSMGLEAAEAFAHAGKFHDAALAYHDVLARGRSLPYRFAAPHCASVAVALAGLLLRLASDPASTEDEVRVALGRASSEARDAVKALYVCRGGDHKATARAQAVASRAEALRNAIKEAKLLSKLLDRHSGRAADEAAAA